MRARTFVFALVCGTATAALAQSGSYVRFETVSPDACAIACAGDQLCASWSFGNVARSYGQQQQTNGAAMCTFSTSSTPISSPGLVSGLPRRAFGQQSMPQQSAPMMSMPQRQSAPQDMRARQSQRQSQSQSARQTQQQMRAQPTPQSTNANNAQGGPYGWDVRPAPWLRGTTPANAPQMAPQPSFSRPPQNVPPLPSATPDNRPRIEYEPSAPQTRAPQTRAPQQGFQQPIYQAPQSGPRILTPLPPPPVYQPQYQAAVPSYSPPQSAPVMIAPPSRSQPSANTQAIPQAASPSIALPTRGRGGRPLPKAKTTTPEPNTPPPLPDPAIAQTEPVGAAPPRQETEARPTSGRGAAATPVRDPNNPESFRGADGMIDAAEMRRAQLDASRANGTPTYSVQREWEAIAAEQQRAQAAGEVRVDPLAGSVPVERAPETRAQRRAREAEEAALEAEENGGEEAAPAPRRTSSRASRNSNRDSAPANQSSAISEKSAETLEYERQVAADRARQSRKRQPTRQALDREPRLSGGPS
jgi:hypothetical protein